MLKTGRRQPAAEIGTRIDPDTSGIAVRARRRGVAMNYHCADRTLVIQELLADPEHVLFRLSGEIHAGSYARVNKHVVADTDAEIQVLEENEMR
jgi:hypothetical protein